MRLEADDGRPETSPATTTRRSNGRSCSRARAASHPGRSGPSTTSRDRPRGAGIRTKAGVIRANTARYPISARCRMPGVPRSTYYWMIEHPETERAEPIAGDVRAAWRDGRERYGARKIKAAPERRGVTASSRRIGNIMREHEQAAEEGARVPEPLHHDRAAEARPQRLRVAVRQPAAPLHPRTNTRRAIFQHFHVPCSRLHLGCTLINN